MGVGLGWLCVLVSGLLGWRLIVSLAITHPASQQPPYLYPALGLLPLLLALLLASWLGITGRTRSALGVLLGLGGLVVFGLVLVTAWGWLMAGPGRLQY